MFQKITILLGTARLPFLTLTFAVVNLGVALAVYEGAAWSTLRYLLLLVGALSAHMAVNMLNEYEDCRSGLDDLTQKTPFSGGSGSLQRWPALSQQMAHWVKWTAYGLIVVSLAIGLYFMATIGWGLLPLGLLGLLLVMSYTPVITRHPWLCLVAPGIAFGPIMVMGSYYVMAGHYSLSSFVVSLIPFFLVNNLLLLNQLPDRDADQQVGRYNLLMLLGVDKSLAVFRLFLIGSYLMLLSLVAISFLPAWVLLGGLTLVVAIPLFIKIQNAHQQLETLLPLLAWNVIINILTPLLMAVGLYFAQ